MLYGVAVHLVTVALSATFVPLPLLITQLTLAKATVLHRHRKGCGGAALPDQRMSTQPAGGRRALLLRSCRAVRRIAGAELGTGGDLHRHHP